MTTPRRRLILLGSTGSIGLSTLSVVDHLRELRVIDFDVVGLATGSNASALAEQARNQQTGCVAIADPRNAEVLAGLGTIFSGPEAALQLIREVAQPGDLVVGAMVGSAGVPATIAAIERGCDVALANKETLVAAGSIVMPLLREKGVHLIPIDSEHSAIFQCLAAGRSPQEVRRLVLTASGGPFRTWPRERMLEATVEETLAHPTWKMGPKVTVDSASLMNKALEVIEAHWLFDLPASQIDVVIHRQSIVHSMVEFIDGSMVGQLSPPDMKGPIQFALTWPDRAVGCTRRMEFDEAVTLDFEPVDHERFPAVHLAHDVITAGGSSGALFNAANEVAVEAFLAERIPFGRISEVVGETLATLPSSPVHSIDDIHAADRAARAEAARIIESSGRGAAKKPDVAPRPRQTPARQGS